MRDFLISNALFWLEKYHFDGLRVDAVASMLYLDFAREPGEWIPNQYGGNQNLEAVQFLQDLNSAVYAHFPDVHVIAEESTAWAGVSRPVHDGGLGFGMKWNMGWMNDTLRYMARPHFYRRWHGDDIRFSSVYAFNENFVLPLSHDEVVYGKGSTCWHASPATSGSASPACATCTATCGCTRARSCCSWAASSGRSAEWHHERTLDWHLWARPLHAGVARWVADLNAAYRRVPALHVNDFDREGFGWLPVECDEPQTVLAFVRRGAPGDAQAVALVNMTPEPRLALRLGLPHAGTWHELLNSDAAVYGGSGMGNLGRVQAHDQPLGGQPASATVTLPPLATLVLVDQPTHAPTLGGEADARS